MRKHIIVVSLILCSLGSLSAINLADFYNDYHVFSQNFLDPNTGKTALPILSIPLGGKYESMGTAFTALADDSGFIESNPAGSATMEFSELSVLHNDWIADSQIEGVVYTTRLKNYDKLGLGLAGKFLYLPFTQIDHRGRQLNAGVYSESVLMANASLNLLSNYDWYGVSFGGNLKVAFRSIPEVISADLSGTSGMIDLGVITRYSLPFLKLQPFREPNLSIGASLKNFGFHLKNDPLPTELSIGIAVLPILPITWTMDFNIPILLEIDYLQSFELINISTGIDIQVTPFLGIQSGFRVEGTNPRFSIGTSLELDDMLINVNYTLDSTTQIQNLSRFSVEVKLNLGDQDRKLKQDKVEQLFAEALRLYANARIQEDFLQALTTLDEILLLDPGYTPAASMQLLIQNTLEKQELLGSFGK